jgi:hypothetical protein
MVLKEETISISVNTHAHPRAGLIIATGDAVPIDHSSMDVEKEKKEKNGSDMVQPSQ